MPLQQHSYRDTFEAYAPGASSTTRVDLPGGISMIDGNEMLHLHRARGKVVQKLLA